MKSPRLFAAALLGGALFASTAIASGYDSGSVTGSTGLSSAEIENLKYMREEEKLARDVYLKLDNYWGSLTKVFANIAVSEQKHTNSIAYLLDRYDIEDPVVRDEVGVFTNMKLQELYIQLIARGTQSFIEGLYVGALIEEVDMRDIAEAISNADERPIVRVYSNLLDGSENHLRAFVSVIEKQGIDYQAQVLSTDEIESILSAESDSGK